MMQHKCLIDMAGNTMMIGDESYTLHSVSDLAVRGHVLTIDATEPVPVIEQLKLPEVIIEQLEKLSSTDRKLTQGVLDKYLHLFQSENLGCNPAYR
jgi:hypothetical protein